MGRWGDGEIRTLIEAAKAFVVNFCLLPLASCLFSVPCSLFPIPS
ncbi:MULTISPECIES: hypothetical protein [Moorena]|nr:hypothetical protein [Moorena sp. SIO4G3]